MLKKIIEEYNRTVKKRDEIKEVLRDLEGRRPDDTYNITITRDRLAYWEGRCEGIKFALDNLKE